VRPPVDTAPVLEARSSRSLFSSGAHESQLHGQEQEQEQGLGGSMKFVQQVVAEGADLPAMANKYCVLSVQPPKVPVSLRLLTAGEDIGKEKANETGNDAADVVAGTSFPLPLPLPLPSETESESITDARVEIPAGMQGALRLCLDLPKAHTPGEVQLALYGVQLVARMDDNIDDDGGNGDSDGGDGVGAGEHDLGDIVAPSASASASEDKESERDLKVVSVVPAKSSEPHGLSAWESVQRKEAVSDAQAVHTAVVPALVFCPLSSILAEHEQKEEKITKASRDTSYACGLAGRLTSTSVLYVPFACAGTSSSDSLEARSVALRVRVKGFCAPLAAMPSSAGAPFELELLLAITFVQALQAESTSHLVMGSGSSMQLLRGVLYNKGSHPLEVWVPPLPMQPAATAADASNGFPRKVKPLLEKTLLQPEQRLHVALPLPASMPASVVLHCRVPGLGEFERLFEAPNKDICVQQKQMNHCFLRANVLSEKQNQSGDKEGQEVVALNQKHKYTQSLGVGQVARIQYSLSIHALTAAADGVYRIGVSPVGCAEWACIGEGEMVLTGNYQSVNPTQMFTLPDFTFTFISLSGGYTALPALSVSFQPPAEQGVPAGAEKGQVVSARCPSVPTPMQVQVLVQVQTQPNEHRLFVFPQASFRTVSVSHA